MLVFLLFLFLFGIHELRRVKTYITRRCVVKSFDLTSDEGEDGTTYTSSWNIIIIDDNDDDNSNSNESRDAVIVSSSSYYPQSWALRIAGKKKVNETL